MVSEFIRGSVTASILLAVTLASHAFDLTQIPDVRIFRGDEKTAYRDPAVLFDNGVFHLYFEEEGDFSRNASIGIAWSDDLVHWSWPESAQKK